VVGTVAEVITLEVLAGASGQAVLVGHVKVREVALSTAAPPNLCASSVLLIVAVVEILVLLEVDIVRVVAATLLCLLSPCLL